MANVLPDADGTTLELEPTAEEVADGLADEDAAGLIGLLEELVPDADGTILELESREGEGEIADGLADEDAGGLIGLLEELKLELVVATTMLFGVVLAVDAD